MKKTRQEHSFQNVETIRAYPHVRILRVKITKIEFKKKNLSQWIFTRDNYLVDNRSGIPSPFVIGKVASLV